MYIGVQYKVYMGVCMVYMGVNKVYMGVNKVYIRCIWVYIRFMRGVYEVYMGVQ